MIYDLFVRIYLITINLLELEFVEHTEMPIAVHVPRAFAARVVTVPD